MSYTRLIVLAYFYQCQKANRNYELGEIKELVGATDAQCASVLDSLFESNMLTFDNDLIAISNLGVEALARNNMELFQFDSLPNSTIAFNDVEEPFYPSRFIGD